MKTRSNCPQAPGAISARPSIYVSDPRQDLTEGVTSRTLDQRLQLVRKYGSHTLAFATLQTDSARVPVLEFFDDEHGYIAFARASMLGNRVIVLGEPVCAPEKARAILAAFVQLHPNAAFVQLGATVAQILEELGLFVNRFGTETFLDLEDFSLRGRRREDIRTMLNSASRNGVTVLEHDAITVSRAEVDRVNGEWLSTRRVRSGELRFMVRPALHFREPFVRKLYAFAKEKLVGFAYYDPLFRNGSVIGFHAMTNRYGLNAPKGTSYLMDQSMLRILQEEGVPQFTLGFSPFSQVGAGEHFKFNPLTKLNFRLDYRCLNVLYDFRGQELRKRKYRGRVEPLYFASKGGFFTPIVNLLAVCKVSNFNPWSQLFRKI